MVSINQNADKSANEDDENTEATLNPYMYIKIKTKNYRMSGEQNCLIQMIDETKNIMY
jgi:hypothetical protein